METSETLDGGPTLPPADSSDTTGPVARQVSINCAGRPRSELTADDVMNSVVLCCHHVFCVSSLTTFSHQLQAECCPLFVRGPVHRKPPIEEHDPTSQEQPTKRRKWLQQPPCFIDNRSGMVFWRCTGSEIMPPALVECQVITSYHGLRHGHVLFTLDAMGFSLLCSLWPT
jgi:hypothetical protein